VLDRIFGFLKKELHLEFKEGEINYD